MTTEELDTWAEEFAAFHARLADLFTRSEPRAQVAKYLRGLLTCGERKNGWHLAELLGDTTPDRMQRLLYQVDWDADAARDRLQQFVIERFGDPESIGVVDETGFLKKGTHSVGVQRQYTGTAGKITNCQIGVSLTLATPQNHLPVDFELYLPASWAHDDARRAEARIPDHVTFKTKPQLALDMLHRAVDADLPRGAVVADEAYGNSTEFRRGCRRLGLDFAVAVSATTRVWVVDAASRRRGQPIAARDLAQHLVTDDGFRRYTWREGTSEALSARFAFRRVVPAADDGSEPRKRDRVWLICEWRDGEDAPKHFHLATYKRMPFVQLVHRLKERWRTERVYQDLKGELGLDHYQGRRFPGWHHHVSVALCCFAFLVAERARAFPPSSADAAYRNTLGVAA
jgi:SRSO17 transposase